MPQTSFNPLNFSKPAPKWFRVLKFLIYLLSSGSLLSGTLQRFGISDADCALILGWIMVIGETLDAMLANGQVYASKVVIYGVDVLPTVGELGVWYFYSGNYYYWNGISFINKGGDRPNDPPPNL